MTGNRERIDDPPVTVVLAAPRPGKPVARVLHAYLGTQLDQLLTADRAVRRHQAGGIHDLRVALRRLRTALATYRRLVDRAVTDPLRDEMRWVAHTLGAARDAEVVRERLEGLLAEEPPELVVGPVRRVLADVARADAREARRVSEETLCSERYLTLVDDLRRLVAAPPWTGGADGKASKALPKLLGKDLQRLRLRVHRAQGADSQADRILRLHDVRKAAKRLRYACEAAGASANLAALEDAAKRVQSVLGEHHDTVLTRARLLELAASTSGPVFTLGRLHALEEAEATRLERTFAEAWAELEEAAAECLR